MPFANYNGVGTAGTGRRLFIDLGVKIPVGNSNFSARNSFMSVSIGINAIKLKDNYKKEGPTGSADNEYYLTAVTLPISYTSSNFIFGDEAGLY